MSQFDQNNEEGEHDAFEQASAWFLRINSGEATEDAAAFQAWLNASPDHASAFRSVCDVWSLTGSKTAEAAIVAARSETLMHALHERPDTRVHSLWAKSYGSVKALAATVLVAAVLSTVAYYRSEIAGLETAPKIYETEHNETRLITLPDASKVYLDASSRLSVLYSGQARKISLLGGQAFFDVAKDAARPFSVKARDRTVFATGTNFNVELLGERLIVALTEGEVIVTNADNLPRLPAKVKSGALQVSVQNAQVFAMKPGQEFIVSANEPPRIAEAGNMASLLAWRSGKLIFENDRLEIAVERMNRYSAVDIQLTDASLAELRVSGVFNAGDTKAFVEALQAYFPVAVRYTDTPSIEVRRRE